MPESCCAGCNGGGGGGGVTRVRLAESDAMKYIAIMIWK